MSDIERLDTPVGYGELAKALDEALAQASHGKGEERHGMGKPFLDQPIFRLIKAHGVGFATGQAAKKLEEAHGLNADAARAELLGAIVYSAAAYIAWGEK